MYESKVELYHSRSIQFHLMITFTTQTQPREETKRVQKTKHRERKKHKFKNRGEAIDFPSWITETH